MKNILLVAGGLLFSGLVGFFGTLWWLGETRQVTNFSTVVEQKRVNFDAQRINKALLKSGWSQPEVWGVWSLGKEAVLSLPLHMAGPDGNVLKNLRLELETKGFLSGSPASQQVDVYWGARFLASWSYSAKRPLQKDVLFFDGEALASAKDLTLRFLIKKPLSPQQLGMSADARKLGFGLISANIVRQIEKRVYVQD